MTDIQALFARLKNRNFLRKTTKTIRKIEAFERKFDGFGEADFKNKTAELKNMLADGATVADIIPEAFALVRSASRFIFNKPISVCGVDSSWDMVHYDVQLRAGIALANRMICEIATGEGKTLIATLPAYVYALFGNGCHIATVNEYLARRDCEWMRPLYSVLGLTCSHVYSGQSVGEKKEAYAADITYGTSSEFGFDYLRDNSTTSASDEKVQRGFFFCLVDEADSILVDEARTPLIISGADEEMAENPYREILPKVQSIVAAQNRLCAEIVNGVFERLKRSGSADKSDIEKLFQVKSGAPRNRILKQILKMGIANVALEKTKTELTTNLGDAKRLKLFEELYYVVDEKSNSVSLTPRGQNFLEPKNPDAFTIPDAESLSREIDADFTLTDAQKSEKKAALEKRASDIAGKLQLFSQLLRAFSLYERDIDYIVREGKVEIIDPNTGRVMVGRRWSDGLHQAVEAKERLKIEAENITYATISIQNYFRMYAHLSGMTGTAVELSEEFMQTYGMGVIEIPPNKPCIRKDNQDLIFLTRAEKFNRAISMIESVRAAGRPVLVGTASVEESEVLSRMLKIKRIPHNLLNAKNDANEASLVAQAGKKGQVTIATNMAGRGTVIKLGAGVNELGGLYILASEHNYSRRIDRQLMGRCARQGDNGETQFLVSLEDELIRKYADVSPFQNAMKSKHKNGVPFSHPLFGRIIERTQTQIEGDYSGARKSMLKFDNPANRQRSIAYGMRDEIISSDSLDAFYAKYARELVENRVFALFPKEDMDISQGDIDAFEIEMKKYFNLKHSDFDFKAKRKKAIAECISGKAAAAVSENFAGLEEGLILQLGRFAALRTLDRAWREHISRLEQLRDAIWLRGYAQKDPYCEFEKEAFDSFNDFLEDFRTALFSNIKNMSSRAVSAIPSGNVKRRYRNITV